ncbi:MAG TPA: hypothetical protein DCY00_05690 [Actinobacteria bacterium]|nr:hypothetical protein [Actinomycetota bacterium]
MNPKITVIIPIYNTQKYLKKCVNSILSQSMQNFELFLIDDGSTDGSDLIAKKFALKDKRIEYIWQENQGQAVARNIGIKRARGEYISFIDSDDWIEPLMLEEMISVLSKDGSDFVTCRLSFFYEQNPGKTDSIYGSEFKIDILSGESILSDALLGKNITSSSVNKVYRTSFLQTNSILYPIKVKNEDVLFIIKVASKAVKASFLNKVYYHALIREGSTTIKLTAEILNTTIYSLKLEENYLRENGFYEKHQTGHEIHYIMLINYLLVRAPARVSDIKKWYSIIEQSDYYSYLKKNVFKISIVHLICGIICRFHLLCTLKPISRKLY